MNFLFKQLTKRSFAKGNKTMSTIITVVAVVRFLQKFTGGAPKTIYKHKLEDGQVLVITEPHSKKK